MKNIAIAMAAAMLLLLGGCASAGFDPDDGRGHTHSGHSH
jgi:uncharacterized protein YceK